MSSRGVPTFWARRIRWGLKAGQTTAWWPVYIWLSPTRRAFRRSYDAYWLRPRISACGWPCSKESASAGVVGQEGEKR